MDKDAPSKVRYETTDEIEAATVPRAMVYARALYDDYEIQHLAELPEALRRFEELAFVATSNVNMNRVVVLVIDESEKINVPHWSLIDREVALNLPSEGIKQTLETYRRIPWKAPWWERHPRKAWGSLAAFVVVAAAASTMVSNFETVIDKSSTPSQQPSRITPATGGTASSSTSGPSSNSSQSSQPRPPTVDIPNPSPPVVTPEPATPPTDASTDTAAALEQALNDNLLQKLGPNFAHHNAGAYLKFWASPQSTWDSASQTATCSIDGSIEGQDGSIILARNTWGPEPSGTGAGSDETIRNACAKAVDDMISSYRSQQ